MKNSAQPGLLGLILLAVIACLLFSPVISLVLRKPAAPSNTVVVVQSQENTPTPSTAPSLPAPDITQPQPSLPATLTQTQLSQTPTRTLTATPTLPPTSTAINEPRTIPPTVTPTSRTPTPVYTFTPLPTSSACYFKWASYPLADETNELQLALLAAGFSDVTIRAQAYGEDCINEQGTVLSFSLLETDVYFTIPTADLSDAGAMGARLFDLVTFLNNQPDRLLPGPDKGYVGAAFKSGGDTLNLWFTRSEADQAIQEGLRGEDLFRRLHHEG